MSLSRAESTRTPASEPAPDSGEDLAFWRAVVETRGILTRLGAAPDRLARAGVSVAAAAGAQDTDLLFPAEADPAFLLARGWSAREIFERALGRNDEAQARGPVPSGALAGVCDTARGLFPCGPLPASAVPVASGALLAAQHPAGGRSGEATRCAVVLVGPGGTATGDFHEGMSLAAARALPLLAIVLSQEKRPGPLSEMVPGAFFPRPARQMIGLERLADRAEGYGIPGETVDGGELFTVRNAIAGALWRARAGVGPAILEVDLDAGGDDGLEASLSRVRQRLADDGHDGGRLEEMAAAVEAALDEAWRRAKEAPETDPASLPAPVAAPTRGPGTI